MVLPRSPSSWLQLIGVAHGCIGAVQYRGALTEIAEDNVVDTVPDHGERATAFWFVAAAPMLWLTGRLLRSVEESDDRAAQRAAGGILAAVGAVGVAAMPASGFWAVGVVGVSTLRRSARPPYQNVRARY